jgi:uncharacterized protein
VIISGLYPCRVLHQRLSPKRHRFKYGLFYFWLNLADLPELDRTLWPLVGHNRPALYEFRDEDHLTGYCEGNLRARLAQVLADQGVNWPKDTGQIGLMTHLRVLGYVFNPVSFYCCATAEGAPVAMLVEVGNTFRELKPFVIPLSSDYSTLPSRLFAQMPAFVARLAKQFYVSPFSPVTGDFDFRLHWPAEQGFFFSINTHEPESTDANGGSDRPTVLTWLKGDSVQGLTRLNVLKMTLCFPMVTVGVIARIHWQAFGLWLKGVPFFTKQTNLAQQQGRLLRLEDR